MCSLPSRKTVHENADYDIAFHRSTRSMNTQFLEGVSGINELRNPTTAVRNCPFSIDSNQKKNRSHETNSQVRFLHQTMPVGLLQPPCHFHDQFVFSQVLFFLGNHTRHARLHTELNSAMVAGKPVASISCNNHHSENRRAHIPAMMVFCSSHHSQNTKAL